MVLEVDVVVVLVNGRFGSMQTMETSSLCLQLWFPQPLWRQSPSCVSVPVQCTSSSQICPLPGPYLLLSERPYRLQCMHTITEVHYYCTVHLCQQPFGIKLLTDVTGKTLCTSAKLTNRVVCMSNFIARQHTDARHWYSKSVRLSVCYVPVSDENGLKYRRSFFSPYGSPIILVLSVSNIFTKFRRGHPLRKR